MVAGKQSRLWLVDNVPPPTAICSAPAPGLEPEELRTKGIRDLVTDYAVSIREKVRRCSKRARAHRVHPPTRDASDLHASLRGSLLVCQCFGMFPVSGLMSLNSDRLRYSWCSFRSVLFAWSLVGQLFMSGMCLHRMTRQGFNLVNCSNLLFYGAALVSAVLFYQLARGWPQLVSSVSKLERRLPDSGRKIVRSCNLIALVVLLFAAAEHVLSIVFGLRVAATCSPRAPALQAYFTYAVPFVFEYIAYSDWKGVLSELFNLQSTFLWNFTDVFIMVLSVHLTAHFARLNRTVLRDRDKVDACWREARLRYCRLSQLVDLVDSRVSGLVLISFISNLCFVCLQLFNSLSKEYSGHFTACNKIGLNKTLHGVEHSIYFVYSFAFLMLRALLVSLLAARVHSAARAPAHALYHVPTPAYSVEVQRFLHQVNCSTVALSGLQFFYVTRSMILTVVGTIVTYELVLLQFSASSGGGGPLLLAHDTINQTEP